MWEKFLKLFETKYRIVPMYADNKKVGYVVQKSGIFGGWMPMQMPFVEKVKTEKNVMTERDALFTNEEDAIAFIKYQKNTL